MGLAALGAFACSSGGSKGTEPVCNMLADDAPTITPTAVASDAPTATGGTITAGVYALSAVTLYTGSGGSTVPPANTFSAVFDIEGNTIQQAGRVNDAENHVTSTFTISGTTLSTVDTCPDTNTEDLPFTATATDFRVYVTNTRGTVEQVYSVR